PGGYPGWELIESVCTLLLMTFGRHQRCSISLIRKNPTSQLISILSEGVIRLDLILIFNLSRYFSNLKLRNMIQKLKHTIIVFISLFIINACDLALIPESDLSDEVFWRTDEEFRQALNYFYKLIEIEINDEQAYPLMTDVMSDNAI